MSATNDKQSQNKAPHELWLTVKGIRWPYALIAFCLAVALWYTVTVRDKVESWVDVPVVFRETPEDLVISDGLINRLSVRIRAARGLSRGLTGRDNPVVVDLSGITKGTNAIAIRRDMLPFNSAFEVMEVSPSRILIVADSQATREMSLESYFEGKLPPDLFVKSMRMEPQKVTISGAESSVNGIARVRIPVPLGQDTPVGRSTVTVAVPVPSSVAVAPPQVSIDLEIGVRTRQVKIERTVVPTAYSDGRKPVIKPERITIVADLPESVSRDAKVLEEIIAAVALPPDLGGEERILPVSVTLPPNSELVSVMPAEVGVSLPDGQ